MPATIIFLFQNVDDSEKDDGTAYYLAMVTKLGDFNIYPLIGYVTDSQAVLDQGSDGWDTFLFFLGTSATFGDLGFEAEFNYLDTSVDQPSALADDFDRLGIYG